MRGGRLLVAVSVAGALLFGCSSDSEDAGPPSPPPRADVPTTVDHPAYGAIEDALRGPGGLVVCGRRSEPGDASGSYERRTFALAVGSCPPEQDAPARDAVIVNAYDSTLIHEGSAEMDFGDRLAAWTYLQFVVAVTESSPPEVVGGVEAAMASLGAQKTYDERSSRSGGG